MNIFGTFAHATAVALLAGAATAPIAQAADTGFTLLAADGPLAGSQSAIIIGGTVEPTPSVDFARAAETLYLNALGFNSGATGSTVCYMDGTDPCSAPLQILTTPQLVQQGHSTLTGASTLVLAVQNALAADPDAYSAEHPLTVFGYSQGAAVGSVAMTQLAAAGIPSELLHFVFIGNPAVADGIWPNVLASLESVLGPDLTNFFIKLFDLEDVLGLITPNDLYPATIYSIDNDFASDWQGNFETWGLLGELVPGLIRHGEYLGLTPEQIADATTSVDGQLTYVDISDDIDNIGAAVNAIATGGLLNSGLFQSLFDSLVFALTGSF
ncbi:PE-PPE domain-containing protein [Mycolicibacter senuensis]|uniref:PE-PPE domain-containing protein n=1 Tax=Mycolicibacter senuensis TaxID=386913 RepID=UPI0025707E0D|nr:PE-PPE domain-containing protein [Mycolicibacter senuensis]